MTIRKADGTEYKKVVTKDDNTVAHMTAKGGYAGLDSATGSYLRAPVSGLIPNVSGGSGYVGTSGWPFSAGYFNALYVAGVNQNFRYSTREQWTGEYWIDGSKIYTKTFTYEGNNVANGSTAVPTGLSATNLKEIWIDESQSFARTNTNLTVFPVNYISVSEYYRLSTDLIDLQTSNIKIDIKWNANVKLNSTRITLKYTKK